MAITVTITMAAAVTHAVVPPFRVGFLVLVGVELVEDHVGLFVEVARTVRGGRVASTAAEGQERVGGEGGSGRGVRGCDERWEVGYWG